MEEWNEIELGQAFTLQRGFDITKAEQVAGGVPIVSSSGIRSFHNDFKVKAPGVVIGRKGTLGTFFFLDQNFWPHDTTLWVKDFRGNDPLFIYYFIQTLNLARYDVGSSNPTLNRNHVHKIIVNFPDNDVVQKRIAKTLSLLDAKIDLLRRQNETLEAMGAAVFREWFVEGDRVGTISDVVKHCKTSIKPAQNPDTSYHHFSLPAFDKNKRAVLESGSSIKSGKYEVPDNCILVSKLNPRFPRVWLILDAPPNSICSTEFQVFKPKDLNDLEFLYFFFKSPFAKRSLMMAASGTSGSHQRVRPSDILDLEFNYNSDEQRLAFAEYAGPIVNKTMQIDASISHLESLRDLLLPKLMSGAVKVRKDE